MTPTTGLRGSGPSAWHCPPGAFSSATRPSGRRGRGSSACFWATGRPSNPAGGSILRGSSAIGGATPQKASRPSWNGSWIWPPPRGCPWAIPGATPSPAPAAPWTRCWTAEEKRSSSGSPPSASTRKAMTATTPSPAADFPCWRSPARWNGSTPGWRRPTSSWCSSPTPYRICRPSARAVWGPSACCPTRISGRRGCSSMRSWPTPTLSSPTIPRSTAIFC